LSPVLQVDKDEWEAFRAEFSKLTKEYETLLARLEQAQAQIKQLNEQNEALRREGGAVPPPTNQGVTEPVKSRPEEVKRSESDKQPGEAALKGKAKRGFWESIRSRLLGRPQYPRFSVAACRKCGFLIREASRFCSGCGADFGALICPCGRDLPRDAKHCDRCGRKPELHA